MMKKNSRFLIVIFMLILLFLVNTTYVESNTRNDFSQFKTRVNPNLGGETTNVQLTFVTTKALISLKVVVIFEKDNQIISEHPYATNKDPGSSVFDEKFIDEKFHYFLSFDVTSGKIGDFELSFEYMLDEDDTTYYQDFYVYTGNDNVSEHFFTKKSALFIGFIASFASAAATYFIISASEKRQVAGEDEYNE